MPADLHYLSLDEVARRLKARKLSSVEATQSMLDRVAKVDPKLKSYATLTPERALADAARLDAEAAAGRSRGALHGVPIAVKDLCNTAGVATAAGIKTGPAVKVTLKVGSSSQRYCVIRKGRLIGRRAGKCSVKVTARSASGTSTKTVVVKVAKPKRVVKPTRLVISGV